MKIVLDLFNPKKGPIIQEKFPAELAIRFTPFVGRSRHDNDVCDILILGRELEELQNMRDQVLTLAHREDSRRKRKFEIEFLLYRNHAYVGRA